MLWHSKDNNNKQSLVLIHGWGFNADIFAPIIASLQDNYNLLLFDLPGHGRSDFIAGGLEQWLDAILPIIPKNSIVVGWSLGGLLAIKIAEKIALKKLVLLASTPCFVAKNDWKYGIASNNFSKFSQELNIDITKGLQKFIRLQTRNIKHIKTINASIAQYPATIAALNQGLDILLATDLRDNFINLKCPKDVILGKYDTLVNAKIIKWYKERDINCHILISGHLPFLNSNFKL